MTTLLGLPHPAHATGGGLGTPVKDANVAATWQLVESNPVRSSVAHVEGRLVEALVAAEVNRQPERDAVLILRDSLGGIYVSAAQLTRWRFVVARTPMVEHDGERYFLLSALSGVRHRFDEARQTLVINADPAAFARTDVTAAGRATAKMSAPASGVFLNYDLSAVKTASSPGSVAGLFEFGGFTRHGVITSTAAATESVDGRRFTRLDTTLTRDSVEDLRTLRVGDTVTRGGTWGRPLRIGGIQYGSNFTTQPGYIRAPTLGAVGQTALPAVIDVFVNNSFVTRRDVPPGPFSVGNIAPISGAGAINIVVTDILGRQQVISQPFYASATLLAPGIADFSLDGGFVRKGFGATSFEYGELAAAATHRYGLTKYLTTELHGEAAASARALGGGGDYLVEPLGVMLSGHGAVSDSHHGRGSFGLVGIERQAARLRWGARAQWASEHYRQAGLTSGELLPERQFTMNGSVSLAPYGTVSLVHVRRTERFGNDLRLYTSSYTAQLAKSIFGSISATRALGPESSTAIFLLLSTTFGDRSSATLSGSQTTRRGGDNTHDINATAQRALGPGPGWGYRVVARDSGDVQAGVQRQHDLGLTTLEANQVQGSLSGRLGLQGGIGYVGGHAFASRPLTESFAVVTVPELPNVRVLQENNLVGRTDDKGVIVVPRMRAYENNRLSVEAADLPLDARIESLRMDLVPPFRSGVVTQFPIRRERAGSIAIMLEDGAPIPAGATVTLNGGSEQFPVAHRGEAFLSGLGDTNVIRATWREQHCEIAFAVPAANDPIADLGKVLCGGVTR